MLTGRTECLAAELTSEGVSTGLLRSESSETSLLTAEALELAGLELRSGEAALTTGEALGKTLTELRSKVRSPTRKLTLSAELALTTKLLRIELRRGLRLPLLRLTSDASAGTAESDGSLSGALLSVELIPVDAGPSLSLLALSLLSFKVELGRREVLAKVCAQTADVSLASPLEAALAVVSEA